MQIQNPTTPELQVPELEENNPTESNQTPQKDYFYMVYSSVLGGTAALIVIAVFVGLLFGLCYGAKSAYDYWFCMDNLIEVGTHGYYYDDENNCFIDPKPHRRLMQGCTLYSVSDNDTIAVVITNNNKYRYINLNTLSYLNDCHYQYADAFKEGRAVAFTKDTLYYIDTQGGTIASESTSWIYNSVRPLTYSQVKEYDEYGDYVNTVQIPTGIYIYEDINYYYGLMSADYVRLTQPIFSSVSALSVDAFLCEYHNSGKVVLVNQHGEIIK